MRQEQVDLWKFSFILTDRVKCIFERESFCQRLNVIGVTDNLNIVIDGRAVINKPIDFTTKST